MNITETLTQPEIQILNEAIPAIAYLVGFADGNFDEEEKVWATRLAAIRSFSGDKMLRSFYETVEQNHTVLCETIKAGLTNDISKNQVYLSEKIERVNPILAKMDIKAAKHLHESYVTYATQIARTTGGFLGMGAISGEEARVIELSMIKF